MKSSARNITTAVLVVLGAAALALAFLRPTSEITVHQSTEVEGIEDAVVDTALVTSTSEEGGFRFLGITFNSPTYRVAVSFTAPPDCFPVLSRASSWPTGDPACGSTGEISGELSGSGISRNGDTIVSVTFEVTEQCWETITVGQVWTDRTSICETG